MIFLTGGAGFIGSNFVIDWLAKSDESIVNLDKLTWNSPNITDTPVSSNSVNSNSTGLIPPNVE